MRLIDADRLKQEIATIMPSRVEVNLVVDDQPDAIVLCKDCKHYLPGKLFSCGIYNVAKKDDWFCADGERKGR